MINLNCIPVPHNALQAAQTIQIIVTHSRVQGLHPIRNRVNILCLLYLSSWVISEIVQVLLYLLKDLRNDTKMKLAWNKRDIHFNCVEENPGAWVAAASWLSAATCLSIRQHRKDCSDLQDVLSNIKWANVKWYSCLLSVITSVLF